MLVSVVLLVQFGNFLAEMRERSATDGARPSLLRAAALAAPGRPRSSSTSSDVRLVSRRLRIVTDGVGTPVQRAAFLAALPVVLGTRYLFFVTGGVYRRVWRYATTADELVIAVACGSPLSSRG